ncbi:branched-chain amino acid transport system permease protein [Rhodoligotrophos appendicifer]|uniref:branched-chain amino acid ABC transporter ATP-binding protein/permease n=1 Tax=Rhodoligotrophos appendicifer TaxID=987056 RepID=UPI001185DA19|nr:ATP-binding cassette domain-containing protein [Rhodoligotrophos appendicifer]
MTQSSSITEQREPPVTERSGWSALFGDAHGGSTLQVVLGIVLVVSSIAVPALTGQAYWAHNFLVVNLFVTVAVLQNLLLSDAGQLSFGQGAVFGIGAYMTGIVSGLWGFSYPVGFLGGVAAATVMGLLFAAPALRVQSFYLGFVTLSAALVFPEMLVAFSDVTNGINGIARAVPDLTAPLVGGLSWLSFIIMGLASASLIGHAWFRRTALGRRMRVAAHSPEAAVTMGWSPGQLRFIAFTIAAVGTGIAGALYLPVIGFVSPYAFRVELSIFFFFSVIVGGQGKLIGPVIGVWVLYLIPNVILADLAVYRLLAYGIIALVIMLAFPDGIVGTVQKAIQRHRLRSRTGEIDFDAVLSTSLTPTAGVQKNTRGIEVKGATKAYGKMVALNAVDVTIVPGTIHAIVGPNGSGKTTLLNVISGLARVDEGHVLIGGVDTTHKASYSTARLGLGRTFQTPRVFEEMSIWDNIMIGADARTTPGESWLLDSLEPHRQAWSGQMPDILPHAQRRLLEILRVLAMDSEIILLDEPAAGLSSAERLKLSSLLRLVRDRMGKTVVLIEHDLHLVWDVADQITVLDAGEVVADGAPKDILNEARVRSLFAGTVQKAGADA